MKYGTYRKIKEKNKALGIIVLVIGILFDILLLALFFVTYPFYWIHEKTNILDW